MTGADDTGPRPATAPRRTRSELRALVLAAGVEVLRHDGLGAGAEHVTFKRVFARVEATTGTRVTNASVIGRIWDNQADFQSAVLTAVATDEVVDQEHAVQAAAAAVAAAADRSSPEGRRGALRELMRVAAQADLDTGTTSRAWATVIGVWALASGARGSPAGDRVLGVLRHGHDAADRRANAATEAMMDFLGLRLRPPFTVDHFTQACIALVEGCTLRDRADAGIRGIVLPTGPDGTDQEWTVLGVGMDALADQFLELDPDWSPEPGPLGGGPVAGTGPDGSGL